MGKGLPRSLGRGAQRSEILRQSIAVQGLQVSVSATGAAVGFGSAVVQGLPEAHLVLIGASCELQLAGDGADANLVDTWSGDFSVGTAPTADATLSGAEVDIIPSTPVGPAVAEVSPVTPGVSTAGLSGGHFDNTDNALEINLNVLIDAADIGDNQTVILTVDGVIHLAYVQLGDD